MKGPPLFFASKNSLLPQYTLLYDIYKVYFFFHCLALPCFPHACTEGRKTLASATVPSLPTKELPTSL